MNVEDETQQIPEPENGFSAKGQTDSEAVILLPAISDNSDGLDSSLSHSLHELSRNPSRRHAIHNALHVAAAWAEDINEKIEDLSQACRASQEREEVLRGQLAEAREENVAHRTREEVANQNKPLVAIAALTCPSLIGIGLTQIADGHWGLGLALLTFGVLIGAGVYVTKLKGS